MLICLKFGTIPHPLFGLSGPLRQPLAQPLLAELRRTGERNAWCFAHWSARAIRQLRAWIVRLTVDITCLLLEGVGIRN